MMSSSSGCIFGWLLRWAEVTHFASPGLPPERLMVLWRSGSLRDSQLGFLHAALWSNGMQIRGFRAMSRASASAVLAAGLSLYSAVSLLHTSTCCWNSVASSHAHVIFLNIKRLHYVGRSQALGARDTVDQEREREKTLFCAVRR